jgi:hypothetical protein
MKTIVAVISLCWVIATIGQVPLVYETFDGGIPVDWTIVDNDGNTPHPDVSEYTDAWIVVQDPDDAANSVVSSTSYFQPVDRADRWLITTSFELGASGNFISWYGKSHDASFPDSYKVLISNSGNDISDFTDTVVLVQNESPDWTYHEIQLEDYANQEVHIAFVITSFNGFKLYLDTVNIRKEDPLSIHDFSEKLTLTLYPNPVRNILKLKGADADEIRIFSSHGSLVATAIHQNEVDVARLPEGIYFVEVAFGSMVVRKKVVKL